MIIQVGIYPPPIGGVSMFNKRFKEYLDKLNIPNELWDTTRCVKNINGIKNVDLLKIPFYLLFNWKKKIIHYHIPGIFPKTYIGYFNRFLFSNQIKVLTQHGNSKHLFDQDPKLMVKTLNSFDYIICVKENDKKYLQECGIKTKITEIPAYITPEVDNKEVNEIPSFVWQFIEKHSPIISMNATAIKFMYGKEVYGVKRSIDLIKQIVTKYPNVGLVVSLPEIRDKEYFYELQKEIANFNIADNVLFINALYQFYPILLKSDLFIRPTTTDGDAVSIRESLHFKIPVLASNAVERPKGTELFDLDNDEDFVNRTCEILKNKKSYKDKLEGIIEENNAIKILKIYEELTEIKGVYDAIRNS